LWKINVFQPYCEKCLILSPHSLRSRHLRCRPAFVPQDGPVRFAGAKLWRSIARYSHCPFYFKPTQHTRLALGTFFGNSKVYPPDNIGMMTIEFPFSIKLSKLPSFLSMRTMTFFSGKDGGKILLNGVGLSKTKCFVRVPTTSAR